MNKKELAMLLVVVLMFVAGIVLYPSMPEQVASHWNEAGTVNGFMSKFWGLFFMPLLSLVFFVIFLFVQRIDPLKENIKQFKNYFDTFLLFLFIFLAYVYALTIFWNTGSRFNMMQFILPALGILFYCAGVLTEHSKRNWFIGFRTPWTMTNDAVWQKTNKLGGELFRIAGVVTFLGIFVPELALYFLFIPIVVAAIAPAVYSYRLYKKEIRP